MSSSGSNSIKAQQMMTRLKSLKVGELRQLLGQYGEKGDKLKKGELVERIATLTLSGGAPIEKPTYWSQASAATLPPDAPSPFKTPLVTEKRGRGRPPSAARETSREGIEEGEGQKRPRGRPRKEPEPASSAARVQLGEQGAGAYEEEEYGSESDEPWRNERFRDDAAGAQSRQRGQEPSAFENEGYRSDSGDYGLWLDNGEEEQAYQRERTARRLGEGRRLPASAAELNEAELDVLYSSVAGDEEALGSGSEEASQSLRGRSSTRGISTIGARRDEAERAAATRDVSADMELCFLGTASCLPSLTRGVSSLVLRHSLGGAEQRSSASWIFDAGEGTQIQAQKSWLRPSQIDKIFVTHLHGDHSFGIAGLMCLIGQDREKRKEPLELYGPRGLRALLRVTLQLTGSRSIPPYRVIELHGIPFLHGRWQREPRTECDLLEPPRDWRFKEVDDGQDVWPDENGVWHLVEGERLSVRAAPMQHTMPCVGYVVQEAKGADRLLIERVEEIVEANKEALRSKYGRAYKKVYQDIKALRPGEVFSLPSGETIAAEEVLVPAREGRKVVFLGDTCDAYGIAPLARGADVVVHEATNAWIPGLDDKTPQEVEYDTISHGHSTPQMAGEFARDVGAKKLILTHFSPRYRGDTSNFTRHCMSTMERYAREAWGAPGCKVTAAFDLMTVPLERPGYRGEPREDGSVPEDEEEQHPAAARGPPQRPLPHMGARTGSGSAASQTRPRGGRGGGGRGRGGGGRGRGRGGGGGYASQSYSRERSSRSRDYASRDYGQEY